jgi:NagD protein
MPDPLFHDRPVRAALFDIDGTLALMDKATGTYAALPGAAAAMAAFRARGLPVAAYTNGTFFPPAHYYPRLAEAGLALAPGHILTPAAVAARHLARAGVGRVLVLGAEGTQVPLREAGIETVAPGAPGPVEAVLIGWMQDFGVADLEAAAQAVWGGAPLYATSVAPWFASARGRLLGVSGAVAAAIHNATGVRARVFGKPEPDGIAIAAEILGVAPSEIAVIGDDATLEIAMARRVGALAIGVTTGACDAAAFAAAPQDLRAHLVLPTLEALDVAALP